MTSVTARTLRTAAEEGWALGAFSAYNGEQVMAICQAAAAEGAPVFLQAGSSAFRYAGREPLAAWALAAAAQAEGEIGVHLDHSTDLEEIRACLELGYGSVMFDGSALPLDKNISLTRRVGELAAQYGAWVEGELAGVAGDEDRSSDEGRPGGLTDPAGAARFVEATDVDALAVSVGNVHGIPSAPVRLDLGLLAEIRARVEVPLVLHGASGLPDDVITEAIRLGVAKVNVNTELRRAFRNALEESAAHPPPGDDLASFLEPAIRAVQNAVQEKVRLFRRAHRPSEARVGEAASAETG